MWLFQWSKKLLLIWISHFLSGTVDSDRKWRQLAKCSIGFWSLRVAVIQLLVSLKGSKYVWHDVSFACRKDQSRVGPMCRLLGCFKKFQLYWSADQNIGGNVTSVLKDKLSNFRERLWSQQGGTLFAWCTWMQWDYSLLWLRNLPILVARTRIFRLFSNFRSFISICRGRECSPRRIKCRNSQNNSFFTFKTDRIRCWFVQEVPLCQKWATQWLKCPYLVIPGTVSSCEFSYIDCEHRIKSECFNKLSDCHLNILDADPTCIKALLQKRNTFEVITAWFWYIIQNPLIVVLAVIAFIVGAYKYITCFFEAKKKSEMLVKRVVWWDDSFKNVCCLV